VNEHHASTTTPEEQRGSYSDQTDRFRFYARLVPLFFLAAVLLQLRIHGSLQFALSDGWGYYVYLPALILEGDLDFRKQWESQEPSVPHKWIEEGKANPSPTGLFPNKYPIGLALSLAPSFLVGHILARIGTSLTDSRWFEADGFSPPYQLVNLLLILSLGAATMALSDWMLTHVFRLNGWPTLLAVLSYWLGSSFLYYYFREPMMIHIVSGFWVALCLYLTVTSTWQVEHGRLPGRRLLLLVFSVSMALVCRPTNLFVLPFLLWLLLCLVRSGQVRQFLKWLPLLSLGLAPLFLQVLVWYHLYGRPFVFSYQGEGFNWLHPALWQTLFSPLHGLFVWTPLALLAVLGLVWESPNLPQTSRPWLWCWVASFVLLWYANSSWHEWWFGHAFGARAFIELTGLFILGLGCWYQRLGRAAPWLRKAGLAAAALAVALNGVMMVCYIAGWIPRGHEFFLNQ
jgi:hypothetical protein